jgi:hypothetical protein
MKDHVVIDDTNIFLELCNIVEEGVQESDIGTMKRIGKTNQKRIIKGEEKIIYNIYTVLLLFYAFLSLEDLLTPLGLSPPLLFLSLFFEYAFPKAILTFCSLTQILLHKQIYRN